MIRLEMAQELKTIKGWTQTATTLEVLNAQVYRLAEVVEALVVETTEEAS